VPAIEVSGSEGLDPVRALSRVRNYVLIVRGEIWTFQQRQKTCIWMTDS
jgi:hypothetical protein